MKENTITTTSLQIDNVTYIVESYISDTANRKPCDIVKMLLLNELEELLKKPA